jgi:ribonuclease P protein component
MCLIGRPGGNDILFAELGEHLDSALQRAAKKLAAKP